MLHKQQDEGSQKDNDIVPFYDMGAVLSNSLKVTSTIGHKIVLLFTLRESRGYCIFCVAKGLR
jgi:hypothetical protein